MRRQGWTAILCGAMALCLGACSRYTKAPIDELGMPSASDSLLYYYGLTEGAEYWRQAATDTIMATPRERKRFLKGLRDGLDAVASVNDTYNRGLQEGIELALSLYEYNRIYGVNLDRDLLYRSIAYALENDSTVTLAEAAEGYRTVIGKLDLRRRMEEVRNTHLSLKAEATRRGYTKLRDDLYAGEVKPGTGREIREGDIVFINVNYTLEDGTNLQMPSPEQLRVGSGTMSEVMTYLLLHLRDGGEGNYATTASALFGSRASMIGLRPAEVVLLTVQVTEVKHISNPRVEKEIAI